LVSEEEEDEDVYPGLIKASEVNVEELEAKIEARRKAKLPKLRMLMEYRHIDTTMLKGTERDEGDTEVDELGDEMREAVDDDVFLDVLRQSGSNVGFLLTKSTS
jgi:DNA repair and recombination protein RAD54B